MAKQNKTTLKGYFETGDIPSQAQYADLIDSKLNLSETGVQIAAGTISSSFLDASVFLKSTTITASGAISSSGDLRGRRVVVGLADTLRLSEEGGTGNFVIDNNAGGNVSQFTIFANDLEAEGNIGVDGNTRLGNTLTDTIQLKGHVTASGNISSSIGTVSFGSLIVDGSSVDFTNLPTSDPGIAGRLYNDSGTIKISL